MCDETNWIMPDNDVGSCIDGFIHKWDANFLETNTFFPFTFREGKEVGPRTGSYRFAWCGNNHSARKLKIFMARG